VQRTTDGDDPGVLRIDFPGFSGENTLEALPWEQWFEWFDRNDVAFLYQDERDSRFSKLVRRTSAEEQEGRHAGQGRTSAERGHRGAEPAQPAAHGRRRFASKTERVTINDASAEELDALWGVGPKNAERIIAYRRQHGHIAGPDDLIAIDGIDGATARTIAQQVDFG